MSKFKEFPFSKIEGHSNLIRDNYSKAIINTSEHELETHRQNRRNIINQRRELREKIKLLSELNSTQKDKINKLEKEVETLKTLVYKFLDK